jgi:hypothetical protein
MGVSDALIEKIPCTTYFKTIIPANHKNSPAVHPIYPSTIARYFKVVLGETAIKISFRSFAE